MTTKDALIELLDRVAALNGAPTLINTDELDLWPGEAVGDEGAEAHHQGATSLQCSMSRL